MWARLSLWSTDVSFTQSSVTVRMWAFPLLFVTMLFMSPVAQANSYEHIQKQKFKIFMAMRNCQDKLKNLTEPTDGGLYCKPVWDNVMCWPNYVPAGEIATQPCADYVDGFNPFENATRFCTEDGTWEKHPDKKYNKSWTDFKNCHKKTTSSVSPIIQEHMFIVTKISTIGYSISLGTLIVATAIMIFFRKLHCQRNTIHINLFISFMFRAVISLLRNSLLVKGFALPSDIKHTDDGSVIFIQEGTHWECKLLNTLWQYALGANYMWIFVEGLYLHTLIFFAVFSQSKKFFKLYIIIGWVFPLIFVIIWILLRIFNNNVLCWNTHEKDFYWVLNAPIVGSILVNFFFFLNIMRVLFTKIRDCNTRDPRRYRKLAKSTLVLIPLFGVYYIFFIILNNYREPEIAVVHMYMEMTLNSFQGTVVAFLFCFMNGEVRAEIMKKWHRHWLRRQSIVSGRSSRAFSTTSFYIGRGDRPSVSQGIPVGDGFGNFRPSPPQSPLNNNNARVFHKVASMPKMALGSSPKMKPLPRVSSSPKVTFSCADSAIETNMSTSMTSLSSSPIKAKNGKITHGDGDVSKTDETSFLLADASKENNKDGVDLSERNRSTPVTYKGLSLVRDSRPILHKVSSMNGLPPLLDVDEDAAETSPMCK